MINMVRGTALIPQRFWDVIEYEDNDIEGIERVKTNGFYIYQA